MTTPTPRMKTSILTVAMLAVAAMANAQDASPSTGVHNSHGESVAPESIDGLRMTFRDYICYESMFLFWPDRYTSVSMALPTCHSYLEMHTEAGKYEWHVTDSRHAYLVLRPSKDKQQMYKFTFDTPAQAKGYIPDDTRPYTFKFEEP
jgi:hypothetical protein